MIKGVPLESVGSFSKSLMKIKSYEMYICNYQNNNASNGNKHCVKYARIPVSSDLLFFRKG